MSEISSKEVYERVSNILKTPFQILKNDYETPKKEVNLAVDWDKDIVDEAMKKILFILLNINGNLLGFILQFIAKVTIN